MVGVNDGKSRQQAARKKITDKIIQLKITEPKIQTYS